MKKMIRQLACLTLLTLTSVLSAENWPGWRGPRGDGSSLDRNLPTQWSGTENVAWKVAIPGIGHASPIIWEDRIFLVSCAPEAEDRLLICLDRRTGRTLWTRPVLASPLERKHKLNSYASSTPLTDGQRVYVSFLDRKTMFIAAYDFEGELIWKQRPGSFSSVHGYCTSPILYRDTVIVNGDHDGDAYIAALDRDSGDIRWKTDRENKTRSYCTPIIRDIDGRTQMLLAGSLCVASYDPADGSRHWIVDGPTEQYVASLVYDGELIYLTCGFPQEHLMGIRPSGQGNVTDTHVVWHHRTKNAAYVPSPIVENGHFVVPDDFGTVTCYEAKTGKLQWRERLARHYSASALKANELVYLIADKGLEGQQQGVTTIIRPGPKLDIVAKNVLGEPVYASPAVYQGQLFLRGAKHLYCIGAEATPADDLARILRRASQHVAITDDWGTLTWMASKGLGNVEGLTVGRATIKAGQTNPRHRHPHSEEVLILLKGKIKHTLDDQTITMSAGDVITIKPGVFHNATCIGPEDADMIVVYSTGTRGFELEGTRK